MSTEEDLEEGEEEDIEEDLIGKYMGERNSCNERHGKGWAILPNLDQYDGEYKRGIRHGTGLYVFRNGARYYGRYRCGSKSGTGKFIYPDGSVYDGNWRKNLKHGFGTYTYKNGDIYRGMWYKGQRHGLGVYIYKGGDVCFKGTWNQGIQVGPAEVHFKNHKFHGNWDYQYPQGPGVFTFNCQYMLFGYYKSDPKPTIDDGEEEEDFLCEEGEEGEEEDDMYDGKRKLIRVLPSKWYSREIAKYDYSKLPQQPVPLPISDSEESICDLSSHESEMDIGEHEICETEGDEQIPYEEEKDKSSDACPDPDDKSLI